MFKPFATLTHTIDHARLGRVRHDAAVNLAVSYFKLFAIACTLALAIGVPFAFKQKLGSGIIAAVFLLASLGGQRLAQSGRPALAINIFAPVLWLVVAAYLVVSQRVGTAGLIVSSFLPIYAAIAGLHLALTFAGSFILFAFALFAAIGSGLEIPNMFSGGQNGDLLVAAFSTIVALLPLPTLFGQMNEALAHAESEIAERQVAEAALRESSQRLKDFSRGASDWFWETDAAHRFSYVSSQEGSGGHLHHRDIIGQMPWEANPGHDAAQIERWHALYRLLESHQPFRELEHQVEVRHGDIHWISISGIPITGEGGQFLGYRGSTSNITARKQSELEIAHARDAAESSNRAKSQFLANLSHEVRTPLNGILGMAGLLDLGELDADQRLWLAELKTSGRSLQNMLDRILDFATLEAGTVSLRRDPFNLHETLDMTLHSCRASAEAKGLMLDLAFDGDQLPPIFLGDGQRLKQILGDLIDNAIKFTETGDIQVRVTHANHVANEAHVLVTFTITDTGCGISPEHQQSIFEAFSQADGSITRKAGGNGLGLAICRNLVALMGGTLALESSPGAGTTVKLSLPFNYMDEH